ncbi:type III secretion system actin-recruiting effector Tarp [Chlamydia suis]|uniref:type III secretion system actin-recruiting effector Tarp n=3 Tax=Chlamydia suis TaxID=83559 RepID=UPI001C79329B|nr:type III secretion system actin-recruiting effector Tarp [Chlamydia suis]QYC80915.1 type III secretion system actin-recruiting effector Tarp [Chlamydia suis]QYC83627.1 type III secretion system actin-recruiting effector Tarp [Chlamydia suis]
MTTPISNTGPNIPTVTVSTTTASSGSLGTSSVSTTSTNSTAVSTSTKTSSLAETAIPTSGEQIQASTGSNTPITASVSTESPSQTASASANKAAASASRNFGTSESSDSSKTNASSSNHVESSNTEYESGLSTDDDGSSSSAEVSHSTPSDTAQTGKASGDGAAVRQLRSSTYTTSPRNENVLEPGPEGLPDMSLPSYNPTDRNSLLNFLADPKVKGRMLEHSGNLVYIDPGRSSFIFVPNGNWDKVCSMKVQNGKNKQDLGLKDLEDMCAKFCTGYAKFSSDWDNRVEPLVASKAGVASGGNLPDKVIINNKFRTCVAYGPWNATESGRNYTPSAWRRGHQVDFGKIFDGLAPFNKINWGSSSGPGDDGISFSNETSEPFATPPSSPSGTPVINVNVNVGGTSVNIGDTNVSGSSGSSTPTASKSVDMSTDTSDLDTSDIDTTDQTGSLNADIDDVSDADSGIGEDSVSDTESTDGDNSGKTTSASGKPTSSIEGGAEGPDILAAVRKHLDKVYPGENGGSTEGPLPANQNLGKVISDMEKTGTAEETVISQGNADIDDISDADSGIGEDGVSDTESTDGDNSGKTTSASGKPTSSIEGGAEGPDILAAVRKHLDKVYPGENGGSTEGPLPANQNLGKVISDMEKTGTAEETVISPGNGSGKLDSLNADIDDVSDADSGIGDDGVSDTESTDGDNSGKTTSASGKPTSSIEGGAEGPDILAAVRKHLDKVYPGENGGSTEGPLPANQNLGKVISDMEQTGTAQETVVSSPYQGTGKAPTNITGMHSTLPPVPTKPTTKTPRTDNNAPASGVMARHSLLPTGKAGSGGLTLEELLPRVRAHLDESFSESGELISKDGPQLGSIVDNFRKETGSGGIIAYVENVPGNKGTASPLTGGDSGKKAFDAARETAQALGTVAGKLNMALQAQKLENITKEEGTSSIGQDLFKAAAATTKALGSLIDNIG